MEVLQRDVFRGNATSPQKTSFSPLFLGAPEILCCVLSASDASTLSRKEYRGDLASGKILTFEPCHPMSHGGFAARRF
jgi:hypothetical protein